VSAKVNKHQNTKALIRWNVWGCMGVGGSGSPTTTAPMVTSSSSAPAPSGTPTGSIVGGVVGGIAGLGIIALVIYFIMRLNRGKGSTANTCNGGPPPTSPLTQDQKISAYAPTGGGKAAPTAQEL
jgi:hypothetical protein